MNMSSSRQLKQWRKRGAERERDSRPRIARAVSFKIRFAHWGLAANPRTRPTRKILCIEIHAHSPATLSDPRILHKSTDHQSLERCHSDPRIHAAYGTFYSIVFEVNLIAPLTSDCDSTVNVQHSMQHRQRPGAPSISALATSSRSSAPRPDRNLLEDSADPACHAVRVGDRNPSRLLAQSSHDLLT